MEFAHYVRFEAPADVCLTYAARVVPGATLGPVDDGQLERDARPLREGAFQDFAWFDLAKAKNLVGASGLTDPTTRVWVDQERGVFYFCKTD